MADFTQAINYVLRRLREDEVAAPDSSAYASLIGDFVNETKRELEDIHDWQNLRTEIQISMVQGQTEYSITGSTDRGRVRNVFHDQDMFYLQKGRSIDMRQQLAQNPTAQGRPHKYVMTGNDGTDRTMKVYLRPNAEVQTLTCEVVVPQPDITDGNTEFSIPHWPIFLGAFARAADERGEDGSTDITKANAAYAAAFADAIANDLTDMEGEMNWYED